jgi:polyphosphate kinase
MAKKDPLQQKERFFHRDLSWLSFNERVLEEAVDPNNPLLERAKFLAIFANNLDEFLMVRLAGLRRLLDSGYDKRDTFGYYPQELFTEVRARTDVLIRRLYDIYVKKTKKDLEKNNISLKDYEALNNEQKKYARKYFETTLFPIITPMAIDPGHPFPVLRSKTIAFAMTLSRYNRPYFAVVPVPKVVPRLVRLPSEGDEFSFVLVDEIIRNNIANFFKGYKITACSLFRLLRDSELLFDEEYAPDLLRAIENELKKRPHADVVHLEVETSCPQELLEMLCGGIGCPESEVTRIGGDLDLTCLFELLSHIGEPELSYRPFEPARIAYEDVFDRVKESDFLLHVPYQSFEPTIDLIQTAANDEDVLAIKMTLYRTDEDSRIIEALKQAAKNGKQVTVLVEIKARFEEEKNINWVRELEEAGCHVMYGMPTMKIHSKVALVVRKENGRIRRYVHLSTGNYNERTARVYTDLGYFTANDDFGKDVSEMLNVITGYSLPSRWKRIISSPDDLRQYFRELIDREIALQKKHKNGAIFAKMNSLEDTQMIDKLYEASQAGVSVRLIVRGICCLVPGLADLSENIEVRSIVGRFLEHSRIYIFNNNSDYRVFLSSADWMTRNLDRRVELLFEILKQDLKEHLASVMETYWKDTLKSRVLLPDKLYERVKSQDGGFNAQEHLIRDYAQ